jgi:hypothetical protein
MYNVLHTWVYVSMAHQRVIRTVLAERFQTDQMIYLFQLNLNTLMLWVLGSEVVIGATQYQSGNKQNCVLGSLWVGGEILRSNESF